MGWRVGGRAQKPTIRFGEEEAEANTEADDLLWWMEAVVFCELVENSKYVVLYIYRQKHLIMNRLFIHLCRDFESATESTLRKGP